MEGEGQGVFGLGELLTHPRLAVTSTGTLTTMGHLGKEEESREEEPSFQVLEPKCL